MDGLAPTRSIAPARNARVQPRAELLAGDRPEAPEQQGQAEITNEDGLENKRGRRREELMKDRMNDDK
jgi:hypothetical protein